MIGENNIRMSLPEFQQLHKQLLNLGYHLRNSSVDMMGENGSCACCGGKQVLTITFFVYKAATGMSRGYIPAHGGAPFRAPLLDGRMFDLCFECWQVVEIAKTADGEPNEN